jgi:hypothetical protein
LSNDDLLRPTLSANEAVPSLYHPTGLFLSSFFGGPLGAAIYGIANSLRLKRLSRELPLLLVFAAAGFGLCLALDRSGLLGYLSNLMGGRQLRNYEIFLRALGLMVFGAIYLMHRRFLRAATATGTGFIAGWLPGFVAVVVGAVGNMAFFRWLLAHH